LGYSQRKKKLTTFARNNQDIELGHTGRKTSYQGEHF